MWCDEGGGGGGGGCIVWGVHVYVVEDEREGLCESIKLGPLQKVGLFPGRHTRYTQSLEITRVCMITTFLTFRKHCAIKSTPLVCTIPQSLG